MMRGFGRDVPKVSSGELLGELEAERDLEREEERIEAEARLAREQLIDSFLSEFDGWLYATDDEGNANMSDQNIPGYVETYVGYARTREIEEIIPEIGLRALRKLLYGNVGFCEQTVDLREKFRIVNKVARTCRVANIPEEFIFKNELDRDARTPDARLFNALYHPAYLFARLNQRVANTPHDTVGSLIPEAVIDMGAGRVSLVALARKSMEGVPLEDQRAAIIRLIDIYLQPGSFQRHGGYGGANREFTPMYPPDTMERFRALIKAFPFAKKEIVDRVRATGKITIPIVSGQFIYDPRRALDELKSGRRFAREMGLEVSMKNEISDFFAQLEYVPEYPVEDAARHPFGNTGEDFHGQMKTLRELIPEVWEFLPASLVSASKAIRALLLKPENRNAARFKEYADAVGTDWNPGEKWPNDEDVRALYEEACSLDRHRSVTSEYAWNELDAIESITGTDRVRLLPSEIVNLVRTALDLGEVPLTREALSAAFRERLSESRHGKLSLLSMARTLLGTDAFALFRAPGVSVLREIEQLHSEAEGGWDRSGSRKLLEAYAVANGISQEQLEFLYKSAELPILDRIVQARRFGFTVPTVDEQTFSHKFEGWSMKEWISVLGRDFMQNMVMRVSQSLRGFAYLRLAEMAAKERIAVPAMALVQFHDAIKDGLESRVIALLGKKAFGETLRRFVEISFTLEYAIKVIAVADRYGIRLPDISEPLFHTAVSSHGMEMLLPIVSRERLSELCAGVPAGTDAGMYFDRLRFSRRNGFACPEPTRQLVESAIRNEVYLGAFPELLAGDRERLSELCAGVPAGTDPGKYFRRLEFSRRNGIACPEPTQQLVESAIRNEVYFGAFPELLAGDRERLSELSAGVPAGTDPGKYFRRLEFSRRNGIACPEPTRQLVESAIVSGMLADIFSQLPVGDRENVLSGQTLASLGSLARTLVTDHFPALKEVFDLRPKVHAGDTVGLLLKISMVQRPLKNIEIDPWTNDLPAILSLSDLTSANGREEFLGYLQEFGMLATRELRLLHRRLYLGKSVVGVSAVDRKQLLGIGVRFPSDAELAARPEMPVGGIIRQLGEIVDSIPGRLLAGERIGWLDSPLGKELFNVMLGESTWNTRDDSVTEMQHILEVTAKKSPGSARIPDGYIETVLTVKESSRSVRAGAEERLREFLASDEVAERFVPLAASWRSAVGGVDAALRLEEIHDEAGKELDATVAELELVLDSDDAAFEEGMEGKSEADRSKLRQRRTASKSERGRAGLQKQRDSLLDARAELNSGGVQTGIRMIEWIAAKGSSLSSGAAWLRELSARDMAGLISVERRRRIEDAVAAKGGPTLEAIVAIADVQGQYVDEHYLSPTQDPEHTGHPPFSKLGLAALRKAWHLARSPSGRTALEELREKGRACVEDEGPETEAVASVRMIPVVGLLRVYGGEIGDACWSSQHRWLASGSYPKLNVWLYGQNDARDRLKLQGSVIALNLTTKKGVPTLVVRANNPKESFVRSLEASSFVVASLREAVATARRAWQKLGKSGKRGSQIVAIPMDRARESSTNRETVAAEYQRRFSDNPRMSFVTSAESGFNGYDLTGLDSDHPCVEIWRIDADGKETWTGDWN